jgi:hypothetical protein
MRVVVESNFDLWGEFEKREVELPEASPTLRTLLEEISRSAQGEYQLIDSESDDVDPFAYQVFLRGSAYQLLPDRLETRLREGEKISVMKWMDTLGGG